MALNQVNSTSNVTNSTIASPDKDERRPRKKAGNLFLNHVPSTESDLLIDQINQGNLTWEANTCMLQKSHPKYNSEECLDDDIEEISFALIDSDESDQQSHNKT